MHRGAWRATVCGVTTQSDTTEHMTVSRSMLQMALLHFYGWVIFHYMYTHTPRHLLFIFSSVQFSHQLRLTLCDHGLQHARPPCPSPTPRVYSNSCPLSWWSHPTISSSSVIPFSSCLQSFPASGSLQMSQLFAWGGQSIGVSASASSFQWTPRADFL